MIIKYLHTFLFVVVFSSFSFAQGEWEKVKESYREILCYYPKALRDHFLDPDKANLIYLDISVPGVSNLNQLIAIFMCDSALITTIEEKAIQNAVAIYHFTDSCLMMVDYDSSFYDSTVIKLRQCNNFDEMVPIPNFEFCLKGPFPKEFYEKAKIYVLGAAKGKFLRDELLWNQGVKLPKEWENGFTRGIVVSGNIAIYWLEIW